MKNYYVNYSERIVLNVLRLVASVAVGVYDCLRNLKSPPVAGTVAGDLAAASRAVVAAVVRWFGQDRPRVAIARVVLTMLRHCVC